MKEPERPAALTPPAITADALTALLDAPRRPWRTLDEYVVKKETDR